MHNHQPIMPLNLKTLRTRFTLNFLRALKKINQIQTQDIIDENNNINNNINNVMVVKTYKKVKVAADASLASAVGPRRAWARSILLRARPGSRRLRRVLGRRRRAEMGRAEELRRLVPGGEAMEDMQCLLDETLHYVMCLNTQVNVMRNIVDFCSKSS
ncbi:hypothetical protein RND81_02G017100 [Saponaria officinalis]|uniref:IBH1-like N-terminal domain-containing protein n=1 Tax=Saponaria officinalis TaxID=3572 RepID=A0AAW1MJX0_SAPOF